MLSKTDTLKGRIRDALRSSEFQKAAAGLSEADLPAAVRSALKRRAIGVTLISVGPADKAALADFAAIWHITAGGKPETSWFSLKGR